MTFATVDPATGETLATYEDSSRDQVERALCDAHEAYLSWRELPTAERTAPLRSLGALLRERSEQFGRLMTREMGKPLAQAVAEAEKCAWVCEYYAEHAAALLAPVPVETDASRSYYTFRPLGVILGIMPWNFPFWQVIRFAVPTLTAGNAVLLKHAPGVPQCALALEALFRDAGYPPPLYRNLFVDTDVVAELIRDRRIQGVSLTGSVRAGKAVAAHAGAAIKKCVLELGGSDPSVILEDADVHAAVNSCLLGRMLNTGQSCIAAKRFVVVRAVLEPFVEALLARMQTQRMGDPMDPRSDLGPMARLDLRDTLHDQVTRSVAGGARLLMGGTVPEGPGAWYPPTLLTDVGPGMPAYEEELFGPVSAVIPVRDERDAVRVANDTRFGLGAAVYTANAERGERIARDLLEAGNCFVNGIVRSDPRLPFGGIKESGYGRELSLPGIREFTNVKTVWIA